VLVAVAGPRAQHLRRARDGEADPLLQRVIHPADKAHGGYARIARVTADALGQRNDRGIVRLKQSLRAQRVLEPPAAGHGQWIGGHQRCRRFAANAQRVSMQRLSSTNKCPSIERCASETHGEPRELSMVAYRRRRRDGRRLLNVPVRTCFHRAGIPVLPILERNLVCLALEKEVARVHRLDHPAVRVHPSGQCATFLLDEPCADGVAAGGNPALAVPVERCAVVDDEQRFGAYRDGDLAGGHGQRIEHRERPAGA
jgi:hypothetical protein